MTLVRSGLSLALALVTLTSEPTARACTGIVLKRLGHSKAMRLIRRAEVALAAGNAKHVLALMRRELDDADGFSIEDPNLNLKPQQVLAVADIRVGDARDVADANQLLRVRLTGATDSPWLKTRLTEGLSRTKEGQREAREILRCRAMTKYPQSCSDEALPIPPVPPEFSARSLLE